MNFVDFKYAILLAFDGWDLKLEVQRSLKRIMKGSEPNSPTYRKAREFYREIFPAIWHHHISDIVEKWWDFIESTEYRKLAYPEIYGDL